MKSEPTATKRFVVYEIWTRSRVVEAASEQDVYDQCEPIPISGLSLCNWHVVAVDCTCRYDLPQPFDPSCPVHGPEVGR